MSEKERERKSKRERERKRERGDDIVFERQLITDERLT